MTDGMIRLRALVVVGLLTSFAGQTAGVQAIYSFESSEDLQAFQAHDAHIARDSGYATEGKSSLLCIFSSGEKELRPGFSLQLPHDGFAKENELAFDVFNPGATPAGLHWRVRDDFGREVFGKHQVGPNEAQTVTIGRGELAISLDVSNIKSLHVYIRSPQTCTVLYFDNFRFQNLGIEFNPWRYIETAEYTATDEDKQSGYVLFSRHWLDYVFPNSCPRAGETNPNLNSFATPGEFEPLTLSVLALETLRDVSVQVSDLVCDRGRIRASQIEVYPVRCLDKRVDYRHKDYIENLPVLLEERSSIAVIAAGQSRRFWLDVFVPRGTPGGIYEGAATFRQGGKNLGAVPIRMVVLPYVLSEPRDMSWGVYYLFKYVGATRGQKRASMYADMLDMRRHGMTCVALDLYGHKAYKRAELTESGQVVLTMDENSLFVSFMDIYRDLGFPADVLSVSDPGQGFAKQYPFMSAEYVKAYKAFWVAMVAEARRRGWPNIVVQPVDEPGWKSRQVKDKNLSLLKLLKQVPGLRTEIDGPGDEYLHEEAGGFADLWNYNGGISSPQTISEAKKDGHQITIYNCDVESIRPEVSRYVTGFFQKAAGINGYFNWAYMDYNGSPYDDKDYRYADLMHVYPPIRGEPGGPSASWQGFREGIDDYKYVFTLEQAILRAEQSTNPRAEAAARQARDKLRGFLSGIKYSRRVRYTASWTVKRNVGDTTLISGSLKIPNGLEFSDYDSARQVLATETMNIMAALGELPDDQKKLLPEPTNKLSSLP